MKVVVIKYNAGNIQSVLLALKRLGINAIYTDDKAEILSADKVIFPGVGEASSTMRFLRAHGLNAIIPNLKQPLLGICLGLQLLCSHSEENDTHCLGVFDVKVKKFNSQSEPKLKVPHMGWNSLLSVKGPLFEGISENSYMYFVHSYYAESNANSIADCEYGVRFAAALNKDNFYALQFHPEKSSKHGATILENFLKL
jgi:imidazole glycerol-phosphate synthase subunit HisH